MDQEKVKEFLRFQFHRRITNLYKDFLVILEDSSQGDYEKNRKRVLDKGNDAIREMDELLNSLEVKIKG